MRDESKQWWAPVWKGLVMDREAKHFKRMKTALWLYLYLLLNADRKTGFLVRKLKTVATDTGVNEKTLRNWLGVLRRHGYVETQATGRCLKVWISRWITLSARPNSSGQAIQNCSSRAPEFRETVEAGKDQKTAPLSRKSGVGCGPNDITIKRPFINDRIGGRLRNEMLAFDLAEGLNDHDGLALYRSYSKRYPESLLREVLAEVMQTPVEKLKSSRGALFNYLVQRYVKETENSLRC